MTDHPRGARGRWATCDRADVHPDPEAVRAALLRLLAGRRTWLAPGPRCMTGLCRAAGLPIATVVSQLAGRRPLRRSTVRALADALGVDAGALG